MCACLCPLVYNIRKTKIRVLKTLKKSFHSEKKKKRVKAAGLPSPRKSQLQTSVSAVNVLNAVNTRDGKGLAWIRYAINSSSLTTHAKNMFETNMSEFPVKHECYESFALVRHPEYLEKFLAAIDMLPSTKFALQVRVVYFHLLFFFWGRGPSGGRGE